MSALLDSLCGRDRLAEIARNEPRVEIVTHESFGVKVTEVFETATQYALRERDAGQVS